MTVDLAGLGTLITASVAAAAFISTNLRLRKQEKAAEKAKAAADDAAALAVTVAAEAAKKAEQVAADLALKVAEDAKSLQERLHDLDEKVDGKLTRLLAEAKEASRLEGVAQGVGQERAAPQIAAPPPMAPAEPTPVVIVQPPDSPVPVVQKPKEP